MEIATNKIGIISINKNTLDMNYGSALQSFAFQKYLDKIGIDNVIIDYKFNSISDYCLDFPVITAIKKKLRIRTIIGHFLRLIWHKIKYNNFMLFYKNNCRTVDSNGKPFSGDFFERNKKIDSFDFEKIVCGSDVIWSPRFPSKGFDRAFFCDYEFSKNMTKVAYAASISNSHFTQDEENAFKVLIKNFDYISVRESQTAEYVKQLTDKPVLHVLDPTLLLDAEDYRPFAKKIKSKKNYLLVYQPHKNDLALVKRAKKLAQTMKLDFIEISPSWMSKIYHKVYCSLGIEEFLGYFLNAQFIVTHAFHGMCFSIIFKKNFYIFKRAGLGLKFKSLISTLNIQENFITEDKELMPIIIDYNKVYDRLNEERKKSINFINDAIVNSGK